MRNPLRRREKALAVPSTTLAAAREGRVNLAVQLGGTNQRITDAWELGQSASYAWLYQTQPAVRTVIDFIARNLAQLALKCYERVDDTEKVRSEDHPAAQTMRHPYGATPEDRWIYDLVSDFLVYENAYAVKFKAEGDTRTLVPVKPHRMILSTRGETIDGYRVYLTDGSVYPDRQRPPIPPETVLHWRGYNPDDSRYGYSRLETLRNILAEEMANQTANSELLKSGLLKPGWVFRPADAPDWTNSQRQAFEQDLYNRLTRADKRPPTFEEGMELRDMGITPKDAEMLAGRRFTVEEVARIYGVPLGVLGLEPSGALDEQRKQVYADVLPPYATQLQCVLDVALLYQEYDAEDFFFEFDLNSKLAGSPEARFAAMTSAVGRPWMLVDEARAAENLPEVDGGDELTIPLNVQLAGDQGQPTNPQLPAPNVMPPQDPTGNPQDGSYRQPGTQALKRLEVTNKPRIEADMSRQRRYISEAQGALERFYRRQMRVLYSKGVKFDSKRWNTELTADLTPVIAGIVEREGGVYAARFGGHDFDMRLRTNYVAAMASSIAEHLNAATQRDFEGDRTGQEALTRASAERAGVAGTNIGARATRFARQEAGKSSGRQMQTWVADTDRHGELDGVSVPIGSDWGGISPGSEPNCSCGVYIS